MSGQEACDLSLEGEADSKGDNLRSKIERWFETSAPLIAARKVLVLPEDEKALGHIGAQSRNILKRQTGVAQRSGLRHRPFRDLRVDQVGR